MIFKLAGTIPPWSNLSSIRHLQLRYNKLQGPLPAQMGLGNFSRKAEMDFTGNKGITGTIPVSWAYFSAGTIWLIETGIVGCIPDGVAVEYLLYDDPDVSLPFCSTTNASDALALSELKDLLAAAGASREALGTWDSPPQETGETCVELCVALHSFHSLEEIIHTTCQE
jgi:hypothetical protein